MQNNDLGQPLTTDDQLLENKRRVMRFNIERIARYAILVFGICLGILILSVVAYMFGTDQKWREYAITSILDGLPAIVLAILAIVGIHNAKTN